MLLCPTRRAQRRRHVRCLPLRPAERRAQRAAFGAACWLGLGIGLGLGLGLANPNLTLTLTLALALALALTLALALALALALTCVQPTEGGLRLRQVLLRSAGRLLRGQG